MANNSADNLKAFRSAQQERVSQYLHLDNIQGSVARLHKVHVVFNDWAMAELKRGASHTQFERASIFFIAQTLYDIALNRAAQQGLKLDLMASVLLASLEEAVEELIDDGDNIPVYQIPVIVDGGPK